LLNESERIPFFYPRIPKGAIQEVTKKLFRADGLVKGQISKSFKNYLKRNFLAVILPITMGPRMDALNTRMNKEYVQNIADVIRGG
jgi:hypothetical protein